MGKAKIWPPATHKLLNRSSPKFTFTWLRRGYIPSCNNNNNNNNNIHICIAPYGRNFRGAAKFHPDRIRGFVSAHARFRVSNCLLGYLFVFGGVLHLIYSQDARTDFDAKYVKRRGSAQGCAFWGSQSQKLSFTSLFAPKPPFWGPFFDGTWKFSLENAFNMGHVLSKLPLIVIVAT